MTVDTVVAWRDGRAAGDRRYICPKGHATVPAGPADAAAVRAVATMQQTGALSGRSGTHARLSGPATVDTAELDARVATLTGRLARLEAEYAAADYPEDAAFVRNSAKRTRVELADARRALSEVESANASAASLDTLVAAWGAGSLDTARHAAPDVAADHATAVRRR